MGSYLQCFVIFALNVVNACSLSDFGVNVLFASSKKLQVSLTLLEKVEMALELLVVVDYQ
jgi:hypothetical protein